MGQRYQQPQAVLRGVLESPPGIVIFALDREYRYLAFNENHAATIARIWGATIRVGHSMLDIIGRADDREKAKRNFDRALSGESLTLIEEYGDEQKERRAYENIYSPIRDEEGAIIGLTVYLRDISAERAAQAEFERYRTSLEDLVMQRSEELELVHAKLLDAQKLESLGVLAGGIAHDFNNLLAVILGRVELAMPLLGTQTVLRDHLEIVRESALEGRMLTKQLLGYSGKGKLSVEYVDLSELLRSMMPLLRASVPPSISLTVDASPRPVVAKLDATQVRQLVLNLVTNAAEAIGEAPGHVLVRSTVIEADESVLAEACMATSVPYGAHACIEVHDDGCGMNDVVRSKIFDPFFTTKVSGRGLGLAAALGTVRSHHGTILLRSNVGQGSRFRVLFPLIETPG
ncbi:MAG: sensory box histidine kinase/response regulator [Labilithrix sp.]|nr:sensory box histidine kinase/response regulator [Labilithrix sp.]